LRWEGKKEEEEAKREGKKEYKRYLKPHMPKPEMPSRQQYTKQTKPG